jgi:hypothetical protein
MLESGSEAVGWLHGFVELVASIVVYLDGFLWSREIFGFRRSMQY